MISIYYKKRTGGFLVLTLTLLVCATILAIATGILLRSISELNQTASSEASLKAWSIANACGEYALGQIASTDGGLPGWSYTGDTYLVVGDKTCYIYPIASGTDMLIKASSTVSGFTRKIQINVATNTPKVLINSWEYVADF